MLIKLHYQYCLWERHCQKANLHFYQLPLISRIWRLCLYYWFKRSLQLKHCAQPSGIVLSGLVHRISMDPPHLYTLTVGKQWYIQSGPLVSPTIKVGTRNLLVWHGREKEMTERSTKFRSIFAKRPSNKQKTDQKGIKEVKCWSN